MNRNSQKPWKGLLLALIGAVLGWQVHASWNQETAERADSQNSEDDAEINLDLFWTVWDIVEENYVNIAEVTTEDKIYGAISGMVNALGDPYSVFMTPEESEQFLSSLDGELEGIGAELTVEEGKLIIVSPLKDSPAEEAGILPGDHIYLVNGEPTSEMTLWEAIMNIRGEPGTEVTLTILREGTADPIDLTITRQKIDVPSVTLTFLEQEGKSLAHLAVYQFGEDTANEFDQAIREILLSDAEGLVLDMRMNGGGYLDRSIEMLGEFFEDELTAVIVKRLDGPDEMVKTEGEGQLAELPLVVLIDEGSASASEIVAGAIQDYNRGLVVGEPSFGKGSVQELKELSDGSNLRLTIAKWYTPNEQSIDDVGIMPDILIEMDGAQVDTENDIQLDAALNLLTQS